MFQTVRADLERYKQDGRIQWWEPSLWTILSYRFGRWCRQFRNPWLRRAMVFVDAPIYLFTMVLTGIHLPRRAEIGPGFRIWHFGGIFLNPFARLGSRCTLRENVCIGNRYYEADVPVLGDDVTVGVGAIMIGKIHIGDGASIGAGAVVLCDVPAGHSAVGNPARTLPPGSPRSAVSVGTAIERTQR